MLHFFTLGAEAQSVLTGHGLVLAFVHKTSDILK
jgi:hypothetical protein